MPLANNICNTIVLTVVLIWVPRNKQADLGQDFSKNEENNAETSSTNTDIFLIVQPLFYSCPEQKHVTDKQDKQHPALFVSVSLYLCM